MTSMPGYNFEIDNLYEKNGIGRTGMWVNNNFVYERISKLELENESIVIIKIGYPDKRKFLVCRYYRQWSNVYNYKYFEKITVPNQEINFENQLKVISQYKNMEKFILGDINVDYNILNKIESEKNNYEKSFSKRVKSIQNNLLANGFSQLISDSTRNNKILDHIYSNNLNKIHKCYTEVDTPSDHNFVTVEKKMIFNQDEEAYILTRDWKKVDYNTINKKIIDSDKYLLMVTDDNTERVTINLINEVQQIFNSVAPIIKIKTKNDNKTKLSKENLELIEKKKNCYKKMKENKNEDNIKEYKIISKICSKKLIENKNNNLKNELKDMKNPRKLWNATKKTSIW